MTDSGRAGKLRAAMTDRLVADGMIGSPEVEAAFRAVPRHLFVPPGTPVLPLRMNTITRSLAFCSRHERIPGSG